MLVVIKYSPKQEGEGFGPGSSLIEGCWPISANVNNSGDNAVATDVAMLNIGYIRQRRARYEKNPCQESFEIH